MENNGQAVLLLGDCLDRMNEIEDGSVDLVVADLPFGTTRCAWDIVIPFDLLWEQYDRIVKPNGAVVLFGSEPFASALRMSNIGSYRYDWVWKKDKPSNPAMAKKNPLKYHETISVFYRSFPTYNPQMVPGPKNHSVGKGLRKKSSESNWPTVTQTWGRMDGMKYPKSVIEINREPHPVHPTQKPVALLEYLIKTYSNEGETVLDNCMGSGTTGVACALTGRKFIGIEKEEKYFNIAKERIEEVANSGCVYQDAHECGKE